MAVILFIQASETAVCRLRKEYEAETSAAEEARRRAETLATSAAALGRSLEAAEEEVRAFKKQKVDHGPGHSHTPVGAKGEGAQPPS